MATNVHKIIHRVLRGAFITAAVVTGMLFAVVWRSYEKAVVDVPYFAVSGHFKEAALIRRPEASYNDWLLKQGLRSKMIPEEETSYASDNVVETEAQFLTKKIRILCLVLSKGRTKASSVKDTWGNHCNDIVFYGSFVDDKIPVRRYSTLEPSHVSFCKILLDLHGKNSTYSPDFDWLLISQDNNYVIIENVRHLVASLDHNQRYLLGRPVKRHSLPVFNALDSVIVLSRGAIDHIMNTFFTTSSSCNRGHFYLKSVNKTVHVSRNFEVSLAVMLDPKLISGDKDYSSVFDTRDDYNRSRFNPFSPQKHVIPNSISIFSSFNRHNVLPSGQGFACCSDSAVSFGDLSPSKMYLLEYFLYHLSVFRNSDKGLGNNPFQDNHETSNDVLWDNHVNAQSLVGLTRLTQDKLKTRKKSLWFNL